MSEYGHRPDDDLVSAYLDGEATPDERARVENDPHLQTRLAEFRRVAAEVGEPHFFPDAPGRDELIGRALDAARRAEGDVVPLRRRRPPATLTIAVAASVLLLALLLVPRFLDDGRLTYESAGDSGPTTPLDTGGAVAPTPTSGPGTAPTLTTRPTTTTPTSSTSVAPPEPGPVVTDLGPLPGPTDADTRLAADLGPVVEADRSRPPDLVPGVAAGLVVADAGVTSDCQISVTADDGELATVVYAATYDLGGPTGARQVLVYTLVDDGATNGDHRLYEIVIGSCEVVRNVTF